MQGCTDEALTEDHKTGVHPLQECEGVRVNTIVNELSQGDLVEPRGQDSHTDLLRPILHHSRDACQTLQLPLLGYTVVTGLQVIF